MAAKNNKPVYKSEFWPVSAAVWRNQSNDGKSTWYSVTLERTYKDNDEWKSTGNLNRDDLLLAGKALNQAHSWICSTEAKERAESKGGE